VSFTAPTIKENVTLNLLTGDLMQKFLVTFVFKEMCKSQMENCF